MATPVHYLWRAYSCMRTVPRLVTRSYAMENLGQGAALQEALSLYERANELLPSHPQIIVNLANLKARLG